MHSGLKCDGQDKTLNSTFPKDEMPSPRGKKLHLRGKKRPKDLFHIPLSPKLHFHGLSETGGLTGGEIFQMVCLYPVTVSRMWALSHRATF